MILLVRTRWSKFYTAAVAYRILTPWRILLVRPRGSQNTFLIFWKVIVQKQKCTITFSLIPRGEAHHDFEPLWPRVGAIITESPVM